MVIVNLPTWDRLADKFLIGDGCWPWIASLNDSGYGQISSGRSGAPLRAHRVLYELLVGPIPDDMVIDHLCRSRSCVNPAHMEIVTRGENVRRGIAAQRAAEANLSKTHCKRGHEFTPENDRIGRARTGRPNRNCRTCHRLRAQWRRERGRSLSPS